MNTITIQDNNSISITNEQKELIEQTIASKSVNELIKKNSSLLVFPDSFGKEIKDKKILTLIKENGTEKLKAHNIAGFIGIEKDGKSVSISITSRFDHSDKQYFLQYMLSKVFSIYLFDLPTGAEKESIWEFLLYSIFLGLLKKALAKGIYKEYVIKRYNDARVRGVIDINRFIKQDIPFLGKIAYNVREHSFDNRITQLIRHTIEHITSTEFFNLLRRDHESVKAINLIREITPGYSVRERQELIRQNRKPVIHPYYTDYEDLRKICLQILSYQGLGYEQKKDLKVYGILFDVAWLWEEYINTLLQPLGFEHPKNIEKIGRQYLFNKINKAYPETYAHIYPDFYYKQNDKSFVLDTKYKRLNSDKISKDDLYQIITYMYIFKASKGVFVYPKEGTGGYEYIGKLNGYGGEVGKYGFYTPKYQTDTTFGGFSEKMQKSEDGFKNDIKNLLAGDKQSK